MGLVVVELYLLVEQNPWKYALYGALPIVFWSIALSYPTELLRWTVALGVLPKPPLVHKVPKRGQWGVVGSGGAALSRERARERARKEAAARTSATPQRAKSVAFQARLSPTGVVLLCGVVAVEVRSPTAAPLSAMADTLMLALYSSLSLATTTEPVLLPWCSC